MSDFAHLHVHSCFSMQDGAADIGRLVSRAAELDMPALAVTDHEGLYGAVRFYQACCQAGIKPIVGAELTLEEGDWHLVLLAQNQQGYANLCYLISRAQLAHRDEDPRLAWEELAAHSQHLIALSGCARGEVPGLLFSGRRDEALRAVEKYVDLFGRDRFYLELQNHLVDEHSPRRLSALADLAHQAKVNVVATNNVHYVEKSHYKAQDTLVCIKHIITVNEPHPERKPNAEFYLKSPRQMWELFRDHPQALRNTLRIAGQCDLELDLDSYHFPYFELPPGETAYSYLCKLCFAGARRLYRPLRPAVMQRLQRELDLIHELGFAEYFLVVWDIVNFARRQGIRCTGRGSAGDSLVCYVLRITDADPMAHANLIFERFMSREHSKMPDIDVDFCSRRREEVVDYIYRKYGDDHVAAVCTLITYRARSAVREVGKALALDPVEIDRFAKSLPYTDSDNIREALKSVPETRDARINTEGKQDLLDICALLNGFPHHISVHVGGLVISRQPLAELVPVQWAAKGIVVAQFDKDDIEALGLVKMDILGLRMHTAVADCLEYIERGRGEKLDLETIPLDDEKTFELIRSTHTIGVFQIESPGQRNLLGRSQPEDFEDLITEISLFRPGPVQSDMITPFLRRRHGQEPVTYAHPALEPILKVTRGVLIYQEQVLQIAH
ncbi:MAG: DNA polymerase III subunit alpha, partial [Armatimonadota bacterium]